MTPANEPGFDGEVTSRQSDVAVTQARTPWEPDPTEVDPPRSLKVLVLEYSPLVRTFLSRLFETLGHEARVCATTEAALEHIHSATFDVALIDTNPLETLEAVEFGMRLKGEESVGQLVFMSTNHSVASRFIGVSPHFLDKPFSQAQLTQVLDLCSRWLGRSRSTSFE